VKIASTGFTSPDPAPKHYVELDGVFEGGPAGRVQFRPAQALTPEALAAIAAQVRRRVLRWFARRGLLEAADAQDMLGWEHGGFSLDAAVRIAGDDRVDWKGCCAIAPARPSPWNG